MDRRKDFIGLDIGSHSLKLVQLKNSAKGLKLLRFGMKRVPRDIVAGGRVLSPEGLKTAIRGLLIEQKLRGAYAAVALPGVVAEVAMAKMPSMGELELRESIVWEYQQRFPYGAGEATFDYQVLGGEEGQPRGTRGTGDVLVAGAEREAVAGYLEVMGEAGLTLSEVDVCALALVNTLGYNYGQVGANCLLIHAGAEVTEIVVQEKGLPVFLRCISGGGNGITRAIEDGLGVEFDKAESYKMGLNIPQDVSQEVQRLVDGGAEELVSKIREALEDYTFLGGHGWGDKLVLSGGFSKLPALSHQLKKQLSTQPEFADPFKRIAYKRFNPGYITYYAPEAVVAVGLALKGAIAHDED